MIDLAIAILTWTSVAAYIFWRIYEEVALEQELPRRMELVGGRENTEVFLRLLRDFRAFKRRRQEKVNWKRDGF